MAKSKAKGKIKVPKTIAGVKVPKALRQSGWLEPVLADPHAREILADVLIAAAGAAAAVLVKERPSMRQVAETGEAALGAGAEAGSAARDQVLDAADAAAGVIRHAAKAILPNSLTSSSAKPAGSRTLDLGTKAAGKRRDGD
jgi:hypothetical protein